MTTKGMGLQSEPARWDLVCLTPTPDLCVVPRIPRVERCPFTFRIARLLSIPDFGNDILRSFFMLAYACFYRVLPPSF